MLIVVGEHTGFFLDRSMSSDSLAIVHRNPSELKNYSLNITIYGDHIDQEFLEKTKGGIRSPLTVCKSSLPELDGFVVKGRRRRIAAIKHGFKTVPCIVWECNDVLEFEEELILDNVRNETTVEERVRMYEQLKRIAVERGNLAKKSNLKQGQNGDFSDPPNLTLRENKANSAKKDSRHETAKAVGLKASSAEKAVGVVKAADELKTNGHAKEAAEVIETLNNGSVAAAARMVGQVAKGPQTTNTESESISKLCSRLKGQCATAEKTAAELFNAIDVKKIGSTEFAQRHKKFEAMMRKFTDLMSPVSHHVGAILTAWEATRKQLDE